MVVRRATMEDSEEDAQAAAAAAAEKAAGAAKTEHEGVGVASGSSSLGESLARYGRVMLVAAVVGFKIAEWWTSVEAQVRRQRRIPCVFFFAAAVWYGSASVCCGARETVTGGASVQC